jgi:hypothetical protein
MDSDKSLLIHAQILKKPRILGDFITLKIPQLQNFFTAFLPQPHPPQQGNS